MKVWGIAAICPLLVVHLPFFSLTADNITIKTYLETMSSHVRHATRGIESVVYSVVSEQSMTIPPLLLQACFEGVQEWWPLLHKGCAW